MDSCRAVNITKPVNAHVIDGLVFVLEGVIFIYPHPPRNIDNQRDIIPRILHGRAARLAICNTGIEMPQFSHKRTLPINFGTARTVRPIGVDFQYIER